MVKLWNETYEWTQLRAAVVTEQFIKNAADRTPVSAQAWKSRPDVKYLYQYVKDVPDMSCNRCYIRTENAPERVSTHVKLLYSTYVENRRYSI